MTPYPLMLLHLEINNQELKKLTRQNKICLGGNRNLKIYGTLHCFSGKRMKKENRVFFSSEKEAVENGFRPCGHCMKQEYKTWKQKNELTTTTDHQY